MFRARLALALALAAVVAPAAAQPMPCVDRANLVAVLTGRFAERAQLMGLAPGGVVEVWVSDAGTWSLTITLASGVACLLASGRDWGPAIAGLPPNL